MRQRVALVVSLVLACSTLLAAADSGPGDGSNGSSGPGSQGGGSPAACAREAEGEADWGTVTAGSAGSSDGLIVSPDADQIVDFWVERHAGHDIVVTDGRSIQVSHDAGCTFATAYALGDDVDPTSDIQPATSHIVAIEGGDARGNTHLVAVVADLDHTAIVAARLRTLVSDDLGDTWRLAGADLPQVELAQNDVRCDSQSFLCTLRVAPLDPSKVYLLIPAVQGPQLWVSTDWGRTFDLHYDGTAGVDVSDAGPRPNLEDFAVDPRRPDVLWGAQRSGLVVSLDAGRNWIELADVGGLGPEIRLVAAPYGDQTGISVVTGGPSEPTRMISSMDSGSSFVQVDLRDVTGAVIALAPGDSLTDLTVVDDEGAARLNGSTAAMTRLGGASLWPLRNPHAMHNQGVIWFTTDFGVAVRGDLPFLPAPAVAPDADFDLPAFDPAVPVGQLPGQLTADTNVVELDPGESVDVALQLVVPPAPPPVDIFFLFDESGSMSPEINALARGVRDVVNNLRLRGMDVAVGVGGYANAYRYKRYREIGPADPEFLQKLRSLGNNGSSDEFAFTALHQLATGTGLPDNGIGLAPRKGHDARWRPGAVRLVIHFGDEVLKPGPGDPTQAEATQALIDHGILHIALVSETEALSSVCNPALDYGCGPEESLQPSDAWRRVTRETGAVAGASGVDCNDDGIAEVREGGEIICFIPEVGALDNLAEQIDALPDMASIVVDVVSAVTEVHELTFHTDRPEVVSLDVGSEAFLYDTRQFFEMPIVATFTCLPELDGQVIDTAITAVERTRHLAATSVLVACGVPAPIAAVAASQPSAPLHAGVAAPLPAAAPPAPIPANAPAGAGSQATASSASQATAPSAQGAAGAVHEKSTQPQVAVIGRAPDQGQQDEPSFLMSATRRRDDHRGLTLAAGMVMSASFGVALMRREQRRTVAGRVRVRR